ncbi:SPOR domain-containing protein [Actinacidiphila sp. ITFR-21]|uniref:SPOR domain-containing protein n=1 Tax=Actinacidiphila sp. ITFR-21 TaxID=3075199 RepID=UPI00288AFBD5|nr:SPOR domain-containing protein [Streptomyces sp. ITFR-21]WNI17514.1 SPOR domain-containing protein [Streptomyces sp. ITFR-21]
MAELMWVLIRQDAGANRYRVGRYATRAEAERVADALGGRLGGARVYLIERVPAPRAASA